MPVTNWPERVFLCALGKAGAELTPLALVFYLNVRVLDQVVVPGRMVGRTTRRSDQQRPLAIGNVQEWNHPRPVTSRPRHGDKTHFFASEVVKAAA